MSEKRESLTQTPDYLILEPGKRYLMGRSATPVEGYEICQLEKLSENMRISRYAVGFNLNGDHIIISRPKLDLNDVSEYISHNKIMVEDKERDTFAIEGSYDAGKGGENLVSLFVGDSVKKNGFNLIIEEGNKVRLQSVTINGETN